MSSRYMLANSLRSLQCTICWIADRLNRNANPYDFEITNAMTATANFGHELESFYHHISGNSCSFDTRAALNEKRLFDKIEYLERDLQHERIERHEMYQSVKNLQCRDKDIDSIQHKYETEKDRSDHLTKEIYKLQQNIRHLEEAGNEKDQCIARMEKNKENKNGSERTKELMWINEKTKLESNIKDLEARLLERDEQVVNLQMDMDRKSREKHDDFTSYRISQEKVIAHFNGELKLARKEIENLTLKEENNEKEMNDLQERLHQSEKNVQEKDEFFKEMQVKYETDKNCNFGYTEEINELNEKINELKQQITDLEKDGSEKDQCIENLQVNIKQLKQAHQNVSDSNMSWGAQCYPSPMPREHERGKQIDVKNADHNEELVARLLSEIEERDGKLNKMNIEVEHLRERLSREMSLKLRDKNPQIVDLSDPMNSARIGAKYIALYDDEWTRVFEELSSSCDERDIIEKLRNELEKCYRFCEEKCDKQILTIISHFFGEQGRYYNEPLKGFSDRDSSMCRDKVAECRRALSDIIVPFLSKKYMAESDLLRYSRSSSISVLEEYINKCMELCWYMCINDPPLVLYTSDTYENKIYYSSYITGGTYIDYVVWPALLIHEGGKILSKGVAEYRKY